MGSKTASRVAGVKLSAIVAAFFLPIVVLGYFLSAQINREMISTRRALDGVAFNRLVWKRLFDFVFASTAFVMSLPIMAVVAVATLIDSGSPILFRQREDRPSAS